MKVMTIGLLVNGSIQITVNRHTQLLFATGIERGIHDCQILKYQPSVTSRVIFHHLIPLINIEY